MWSNEANSNVSKYPSKAIFRNANINVQRTNVTSSMIGHTKTKKHFKNKQRNRDDADKNRANTSGVGVSNYYEVIYNIPPYNNTH